MILSKDIIEDIISNYKKKLINHELLIENLYLSPLKIKENLIKKEYGTNI